MKPQERRFSKSINYSCFMCYQSFRSKLAYNKHMPACDKVYAKRQTAKERPPASVLQRLAAQVNWFCGCRLQRIGENALPIQTITLHHKLQIYNQAVTALQEELKATYKGCAKEYRAAATKVAGGSS